MYSRLWKSDNQTVAADTAPTRLVPLGELVTTHGIEGWLKLRLYNPQSTILYSARDIVLEKGGVSSPHYLERSKVHKRNLLVKLRGTNEINDAKKWVGSTLLIREDSLQPLGPGEYYYYQVEGFDVLDTHGEWIGKVTRIWFTEGGDLYVVTGASRDHLIPAVKEVIEKIDFHGRKVIIDPPEGLLEV
ncbi:MAG: ribosome maturation factor RimM [Candidatus Binatia bacterium]